MTFHERATAIVRFGFTERQARFLTTVMLHSGVCVPRQYARFCGIVHGQKTRKFFAKLVRLGYVSMYDCRHNRAHIYHVNSPSLYRAIDDAQSRHRRPLALSHAIHRLMLLDGIVESPEMVWLTTADDGATHLLALISIRREDLPHVTVGEGDKRTVKYFPDRLPIGIHPEGRGVLVYLVTEPFFDEFRVFLERHAALLRALRAWTLRIVVPGHLPDVGQQAKQVVWNQLMTPLPPELGDVCAFLDAYLERCVKPADLRSIDSVRSQVTVLKHHFGEMPLSAIEDADEINRFKTDSDYAEDVEIASVHRVLERLRAAINRGMAQTPPLFGKSPFHRFGVQLNKKAETMRDRRVSREEEKRLLDTALGKMNTAAHRYVGEMLHDRIIGALELCCRRGEMLLIQNRRVNWDTCQIGIPGATAKDKENRRIPFNPKGRLAAILTRRAALGPDAYVFGSANGAYQPTIQTAWETLKLLANGIMPKPGREGMAWNAEQLRRIDLRWHDLRHEGACRLLADGVDIRIIQLMLGHASIQQTQRYLNVTDEELRKGLEVSWINQGRPLRLASQA